VVPIILMIPFFLIGGVFYFVRSRSSKVETLSYLSISVHMAIFGLDLMSDAIFIVLLMDGHFLAVYLPLGVIFIMARLIHPICTLSVFSLFRGRTHSYLDLLDLNNWREYGSIYSFLFFLALLESSLLKFLPWISTSFTQSSGRLS